MLYEERVEIMKYCFMNIVVLTILSMICGPIVLSSAAGVEHIPAGVTFHKDSLYRSGGYGDNWRPLWAVDDSQITPMCDGSWLGIKYYHNHLYRITGRPESFSVSDIPNYPDFSGGPGSWFGYGVV
jgi:hypothetical protein